MGEDQTQYGVLIITALVALGAITVMGMHATGGGFSVAPAQAGENTLVGAATAQLPAYSRMDYNADGVLDGEDSEILSDVIALGGCPDNRVCDVDGNGRIDSRDLARFNSLLREPIRPRQEEAQDRVTGNAVVREPLADFGTAPAPGPAILA